MTREESEMSEEKFWEEFDPEPGIDADGFYDGQREYELEHGVPLDVSLESDDVAFQSIL